MNKLVLVNVAQLIIIIFLAMPYLQTEENVEKFNETVGNSVLENFLSTHPDTSIQGYMISKNAVENQIDEIRKDCGEYFKVQDYWKFVYTEPKENKSMVVWRDPETKAISCVAQELVSQNLVVQLGVKQERKEIKVNRGETFEEVLHFFNINGDETYYVKIEVLEKPPWFMKVEPPAHMHKPLGKDPIEMNIKVEPSKLLLFKPEKHPPGEAYMEVEGINGLVKTKPVSFIFETPRPAPLKQYDRETFSLSLNITSSYYRGMRSYHYENHIINYTVVLKEKK
jgi:hypothetical protein